MVTYVVMLSSYLCLLVLVNQNYLLKNTVNKDIPTCVKLQLKTKSSCFDLFNTLPVPRNNSVFIIILYLFNYLFILRLKALIILLLYITEEITELPMRNTTIFFHYLESGVTSRRERISELRVSRRCSSSSSL